MRRSVIILLVWGVVFGGGYKDTTTTEKMPNLEIELLMLPLLSLQRVEVHISKYVNSRMSIGVALGYVPPYDWSANSQYNPPEKYGYRVGIVAADHVFQTSQRCIYLKPMFFLSYLNRPISRYSLEREKFYRIGGVVILGTKSFLGPGGFLHIHPNLFVSLYGGLGVDYYLYLNNSDSYFYPDIVIGGSIGYLSKRRKT